MKNETYKLAIFFKKCYDKCINRICGKTFVESHFTIPQRHIFIVFFYILNVALASKIRFHSSLGSQKLTVSFLIDKYMPLIPPCGSAKVISQMAFRNAVPQKSFYICCSTLLKFS